MALFNRSRTLSKKSGSSLWMRRPLHLREIPTSPTRAWLWGGVPMSTNAPRYGLRHPIITRDYTNQCVCFSIAPSSERYHGGNGYKASLKLQWMPYQGWYRQPNLGNHGTSPFSYWFTINRSRGRSDCEFQVEQNYLRLEAKYSESDTLLHA